MCVANGSLKMPRLFSVSDSWRLKLSYPEYVYTARASLKAQSVAVVGGGLIER